MRFAAPIRIASLMFLLVAVPIFAHSGHERTYMGTVKTLQGDNLTVALTDGHVARLRLSAETRYRRSGKSAARRELVAGVRVVARMSLDGKTVETIELAPPPAQ